MEASLRRGEAAVTSPLESAVEEFDRAQDALDRCMSAPAPPSIAYYRLRDVALATLDLVRELLIAADIDTGPTHTDVAHSMQKLLGRRQDVVDAIQTLLGWTNAHMLSFMPRPPFDTLAAGRAAGFVVAEFIDGIVGDTYAAGRC